MTVTTITPYIKAYIVNQGTTPLYFDDISVEVNPSKAQVLTTADYYPFGSIMRERQLAGISKPRFGYQGDFSEDDEETGWNSFELRMYDGVIGRFTTVDPAGQFFSPYVGMGNNPVSGVDPTGGICPTCPDDAQYDAYRSSDMNFAFEKGIGVYNDFMPEVVDSYGFVDKFLDYTSNHTFSLETTVTAGPQFGVNFNNYISADLSLLSIEAFKDQWKYENGKISGSKKAFTAEFDPITNQPKKGAMQWENSIGLTVFGFGGKVGQKQNIDANGVSSGYTVFTERGTGLGDFGGRVITEQSALGKIKKNEVSSSVGFKFIIGIEAKIKIKETR